MSTDLSAYGDWLRSRRYRGLLWIAGEQHWCEQQLQTLLPQLLEPNDETVLISDRPWAGLEPLPALHSQTLLGRQIRMGIIDAFCGFNPNRFARIAGAVEAGGWLVLLSPSLTEWQDFDDPEYQKIVPAAWGVHQVRAAFISRLVRELGNDQAVVSLFQGDSDDGYLQIPAIGEKAAAEQPRLPAGYLSADQFRCVRGLETICQQTQASAIVHADRGRGKSSALGILLGQMAEQARQKQETLQVILTAPQQDALWAVIARLQERLGKGQWHEGVFKAEGIEAHYYPPQTIIDRQLHADILIVDEAAAIATPILTQLAKSYSRVIYATTERGYEGNGRGFTLRFLPLLSRLRPETRQLQLTEPVRWAAGDPLEAIVNRLLLLDAEPADVSTVEPGQGIEIERLDRTQLVQESLLRELYGLLILAHYRTTPGDLRLLLDAPNLDVYVLKAGGHLTAAALVVREGPLPDTLAQSIWEGRRRPRGQLLPQTLIAHEGWLEVAPWKAWRVMRIAVHPALHRLGYGSRLLKHVKKQAEAAEIDYLGASFAANAELLRFWRRNGYLPLRVGDQLDPVAGAHAGVVVQPLAKEVNHWLPAARQQYGERLRYRLGSTLQQLPDADLPELFYGAEAPTLTLGDRRILKGFAEHLRPLESVLPAFDRLAQRTVSRWPKLPLSDKQIRLLVAIVWRQRNPRLGGDLAGRKAQVRALREVCALLLEADADAD